MLKKILIIVPLILILVLAGAAAYLAKGNLAPLALNFAREHYGLDIKAENPTLHLFPSLVFKAQNLTVPNLNGSEGNILTAEHIDAKVGWSNFPRFWTAPQLKEVTLTGAQINLTQNKNGTANWQLGTQNTAASTPSATTEDTEKAAFSLPTFGTVSLTNVNIAYNNLQANQKADVKNLNLNVNGEDLAALKAQLSATVNGRALSGDLTSDAENLNEIKTQGRLSFGSTQATVDGVVENQSSFAGQLSVQTDNLKSSIAEVLTTAPATVPAQPLRLTTYLKSDGSDYEVNNLSLNMGDLLRLTGTLNGKLDPITTKGKVNIKTNNLRQLAAIGAGAPQPSLPASAFAATTDLDYTAAKTKLANFSATLADALMAAGTVTYEAAGTTSAELKLQGNNLRTLAQIVPALQGQNLPASGFTATAVANYRGDTVELPSLEVAVGNALNLSGNATAKMASPVDVKADITIAKADLAALGYCAAAEPQSVPSADTGNAPAAASSAPWTDEPLALDAIQSFTGSINLTASNLNCPTRPITNAVVKLTNTADTLTISSLNLGFAPSGKVTGSGTVGHGGGTLKPNLKVELSDYPADTLIPKASWSEGLTLPLNATADIQAAGKTTRQLAQTLSGSVTANARAGKLPYNQTLTTILNIDAMLGGDDIPQRGSAEEINDLTAQYSIANGIANAQKLSFSAADERVSMSGTGTINLPAWTISHTLLANAGSQKNIPVTVNGNLSAPKIDLESGFRSRIQSRLVGEGGELVNKLLGGSEAGSKTTAVTGAVNDLLGGKGINAEGLNNLVGAFGGKKPAAAASPTEAETAPAEQQPSGQQQLNNLLNNVLGQ